MRKLNTLLAATAMISAIGMADASAMPGLSRRLVDELQVRQAVREIERQPETSVRVTQEGSNNGAAATSLGSGNRINIGQNGSNNTGIIHQNGNDNDALLRQRGSSQTGVINQNGNGASAYLFQYGRNNRNYELNQGSGENTLVIQSGRRTIVRQLPPRG